MRYSDKLDRTHPTGKEDILSQKHELRWWGNYVKGEVRTEDPGETEVTELNDLLFGDEDVLWLYIPVDTLQHTPKHTHIQYIYTKEQ